MRVKQTFQDLPYVAGSKGPCQVDDHLTILTQGKEPVFRAFGTSFMPDPFRGSQVPCQTPQGAEQACDMDEDCILVAEEAEVLITGGESHFAASRIDPWEGGRSWTVDCVLSGCRFWGARWLCSSHKTCIIVRFL